MTENFGYMLAKLRHIHYEDFSFHVVCPICGEPVKPDDSIDVVDEDYVRQSNATCLTHGRVEMPFDGKISVEKDGVHIRK